MSRHKLMIEKILDGEVQDFTDEYSSEECLPITTPAILNAERFVLDMRDVKLMKEKQDIVESFMKYPPYDNMWFEIDDKLSVDELKEAMKIAKDRGLPEAEYELSQQMEGADPGTEYNTITLAHFYRADDKAYIRIYPATGRDQKTVLMAGSAVVDLDTKMVRFKIAKEFRDYFPENYLSNDSTMTLLTDTVKSLFAAVALMNIKGDVMRTKSVETLKLNKARVKKGKTPLRSYTYIQLNHSVAKENMNAQVGERHGVALHLVRGHFKRCATGTFWWRPHFAGTLPEKKRDAYIVKGEPNGHSNARL